MKRLSAFPAFVATFLSTMALAPATTSAQALTAAEQAFADLAKLPPAERTKQIYEGAKKEGQMVITRGYGGQDGIAHLRLFETRYPGIKINFTNMPSQSSVERVVAEERAGRHLTDVSSVSSPDLNEILKYNIPSRYPTPEVDKILPMFRGFMDPTGQNRWVPWYSTTHGIGYNTTLMSEADAPKSWMDLCNPKYKGTMSFEGLETRMLVGLYWVFDKDLEQVRKFMECIGKNDPIVMKGHITRQMLLLAGDHALSPDLLIYRGVFENLKNPRKAPFKVVYEAPVFMDSVNLSINKNAPHPLAGALHVDWSLSEESQSFIFDKFRETVSYKHPFFPPDVKIAFSMPVDDATVDKMQDYWRQYIGK